MAMAETEAEILKVLRAAEEAMHTEQVAERLGITRHTASKYLEVLKAKGLIRCRRVGNAKLWRAASPEDVRRPSAVAEVVLDDEEAPSHVHPIFEELHPPLDNREAVVEAIRCLECGGPRTPAPCTTACPTHIDVPGFIREIRAGHPLEAARIIFRSNVLGGSCARVCPVEVLCEGACVLSKEGRRAVHIGRLQRYATDRAFERERATPAHWQRERPRGASVGVVGAGPAGLGCAAELARLGYHVTVYERRPHPGGLVTYGIAPYKQRMEPLPAEACAIEALGVEFRFETSIGWDLPFGDLERAHDAIFLGLGLGKDVQLDLPGEHLSGVWESLAFIELIKEGRLDELELGQRVAVVGGGNTAIDAAREAVRLGADEVTVIYRRTEEQMPAYAHEVAAAKREGVQFLWLTMPLRFLGQERLQGIECLRMKLGPPDPSGRPKPEPLPGTEFTVEVDTAINAVGQHPWTGLLQLLGVRLERGRVAVDERYQTSRPNVFAGGDCVTGGATVVEAVQDGKRAAWGIHFTLTGERIDEQIVREEVPVSSEREGQTVRYLQGASYVSTEPPYCKGCELCVNSCPQGILSLNGKGKIVVDEIAQCVFCGICEARCPDFAIWVVKDGRTGARAERAEVTTP